MNDVSKKEQKLIVVALISDENGNILLQKRKDPTIPIGDGKWEFPGGRVIFGEAPEEAVKRECLEEIGCRVEVGKLLPDVQMRILDRTYGDTIQVFVLCFKARIIDGTPLPIDQKVSDVGWFNIDQIEQLDLLVGIRQFIQLSSL